MNKKFILIPVVILIVIAGGVFYFWHRQQPFGKMSCKKMYNEIEKDINNANYCQTDSDCDVLILGGWYIEFGCYHFINKVVDKDQFYKKMDTYEQKCGQAINDCASMPNAQCISNKCIHVGQE